MLRKVPISNNTRRSADGSKPLHPSLHPKKFETEGQDRTCEWNAYPAPQRYSHTVAPCPTASERYPLNSFGPASAAVPAASLGRHRLPASESVRSAEMHWCFFRLRTEDIRFAGRQQRREFPVLGISFHRNTCTRPTAPVHRLPSPSTFSTRHRGIVRPSASHSAAGVPNPVEKPICCAKVSNCSHRMVLGQAGPLIGIAL